MSSLCEQSLRTRGCLHPAAVSQRCVPMAVPLSETSAATFLPGVLGPPHCLPQPGLPNRCPYLPYSLSVPRHPSPGPVSESVREGSAGGERHCTLGPQAGTWCASLSLHSELQAEIRREGVLTRTSPLQWRNLGGPGGTSPARLLAAPQAVPAVIPQPPKPFRERPNVHTPTSQPGCPPELQTPTPTVPGHMHAWGGFLPRMLCVHS